MKIEITNSERMALVDILAAYMRLKDEPQVFIDVIADTETTTPDLLVLMMAAEQ